MGPIPSWLSNTHTEQLDEYEATVAQLQRSAHTLRLEG